MTRETKDVIRLALTIAGALLGTKAITSKESFGVTDLVHPDEIKKKLAKDVMEGVIAGAVAGYVVGGMV